MHYWAYFRAITAVRLAVIFTLPPNAAAETHVVNRADLHTALVASTKSRQQNLVQVNGFLSLPVARKALTDAHLDSTQVTNAVAVLSDAELAQLAARTQKVQKDFAAGSLSNHALVLIVIAIAVVVVIILARKL